MPVRTPEELFTTLLNDMRYREERTAEKLQQIAEVTKDPDIKEAIESHVFLKSQIISTLDRCFSLIGEKPSKPSDRLHNLFVEDLRKEVAEIPSPVVRHLIVLAKIKHLLHACIGEYTALTGMADISGHYGVGVLLESCLAEKLAFVERARRLMRRIVEFEIDEPLAA